VPARLVTSVWADAERTRRSRTAAVMSIVVLLLKNGMV